MVDNLIAGLLALLLFGSLLAGFLILARRRRQILNRARASRCPHCQRFGGLQINRRQRIAGTLRRDASGALLARYQLYHICRHCGAQVMLGEEEGPVDPDEARRSLS